MMLVIKVFGESACRKNIRSLNFTNFSYTNTNTHDDDDDVRNANNFLELGRSLGL